jgi:3-hydroxyisobutyrate dehydrogenase
MGGSVARRLRASQVATIVYDLNPRALERAVAVGCTAARTVSEAADAEVVITSLPADRPLLEVMSDPAVLENLVGGVLVELSTVLPETIKVIAARLQGHGIGVVDAPVSGGPEEAAQGSLVLLVGASDEDLAAVRPVLDLLGRVEHIGGVGQGKAMKLVNNLMSIGNLVVAAEAFGLGQRMGLDEQHMLDVISTSGGRSVMFLKHMPNAVSGDFTPGFELGLAAKDIHLARKAAADSGFEMPVTSGVGSVLEEGVTRGLGAENFSSVLKLFRQQ